LSVSRPHAPPPGVRTLSLHDALPDLRPIPARPNTVSVTTAPPISSPNRMPAIVSAGSTALRSTLRHSTQDQEAPLARTTVTNGEVDTSSMLRVRICAIGAEIGTAIVNTGRLSPSHGPGLITEIQPSSQENTWMSKIGRAHV